MVHRAQLEVVDAFGFGVAVEHDLLFAGHFAIRAGGAAHIDRILPAFAVTAVVEPVAITLGRGGIVFLDAPAHLGVQALLQRGGGGHYVGVIRVLCFQMGADIGLQHRRITHHLLPVIVAHPGVFIHSRAAQLFDGERALLGVGSGQFKGARQKVRRGGLGCIHIGSGLRFRRVRRILAGGKDHGGAGEWRDQSDK